MPTPVSATDTSTMPSFTDGGADVDPAAFGSELDGVGQQVQEHLLHLALVGADRTHPLVDRAAERDAAAAGPLADQGQRVVDGAREIEVCRLQLHPPRLDLREVEDVVDEREEVSAGLQNV